MSAPTALPPYLITAYEMKEAVRENFLTQDEAAAIYKAQFAGLPVGSGSTSSDAS